MKYESIVSYCGSMNIFRSLICIKWAYTITLIQVLQFQIWWKDMLWIERSQVQARRLITWVPTKKELTQAEIQQMLKLNKYKC